ncbi:MAG: hypothetical protein ACJ71K_06295 [Nitrososphaeraceae archaeon]|jgi:hypothetical protein
MKMIVLLLHDEQLLEIEKDTAGAVTVAIVAVVEEEASTEIISPKQIEVGKDYNGRLKFTAKENRRILGKNFIKHEQ